MNFLINYKLDTIGILVISGAILFTVLLRLRIVKFSNKPRLTMSPATADSIDALFSVAGEQMLSGLGFIQQTLERLYESNDAQFSPEELWNDLTKIVGVTERIRQTGSYKEKTDIYYSEYRPLSSELKAKYKEFLPNEAFREIETSERRMDMFRDLISVQARILSGFQPGISQEEQFQRLYTGMVNLSSFVEENISDLPPLLMDVAKVTARGFIDDAGFKPDSASQSNSVYIYLINLRNAAKGILWQIGDQQNATKYQHFGRTPEEQLAKNQAALAWVRTRIQKDEAMTEEEAEQAERDFASFRETIDPDNALYPKDWS